MTEHKKKLLNELSKEQLIYLIEQYEHSRFKIGCVCVDESKGHISSDKAVNKIRENIYNIPNYYEADELKGYIDMKMKKITVEDFRKIIGLE